MAKDLRVRRSLLELQTQYEQGNKKPLEDVMRACQTHLDVKSAFALHGLAETSVAAATFDVEVITKSVNHQALAANVDAARQSARIEVR